MNLTTGQMIDRLKVREVAEGSLGDSVCYVTKTAHGTFYQCSDETGKTFDKVFSLFYGIVQAEWCILPQYVSFEEAVKAFTEGKTIRREGSTGFNENSFNRFAPIFSRYDIQSQKWIIEDGDAS
jgi:hypothetical protein